MSVIEYIQHKLLLLRESYLNPQRLVNHFTAFNPTFKHSTNRFEFQEL